ncbi:MAG: sigma 54-interacting transcriptional regulator, partial [Myxococcales bacterium]|nr:sigma 54-interacting transcriptional regulator [Myxococcales bacterium]
MGESEALQGVRRNIERAAGTEVPVLLRGPSGSGKELVARALHEASARKRGPYRTVNLAAVPESTAAAAFFGHTKGAFTGAAQAHPGYFGEADGGTLFLDEVGDVPVSLQPLLLRALETGEVQPVGARRAQTVDVRLMVLDPPPTLGKRLRAALIAADFVVMPFVPARESVDGLGDLM